MSAFRSVAAVLMITCTTVLAGGEVIHVGDLTTARRNASASRLPDGRILVAGWPAQTVEALELHSGRVVASIFGATRLPLVGHSATALPDGRIVFIAGGYTTDGRPGFGQYGNVDVDIIDASGLRPVTSLVQHRTNHAATLLDDGRILVTGGHSTNIGGFHVWETVFDSAEIVDPAAGSSQVIAPMNQARTKHTATMLADGRVLIAGGHIERLTPLSSAELFDPVTGRFTALPPMRAARYGHTASTLPDGRVLLAGGSEEPFEVAELFDPATNTFMPAPGVDLGYRRYHTATWRADGTLLFAGGAEDAVLYDPAADAIVDQVMLGGSLTLHAALALPGGDVLLIGGSRDSYAPRSGILRYSRFGSSRRRAVR